METLFEIPWSEVSSWDVEGANAATRRSSAGRAATGALLAGVPGAIIGMAATKEEFSSAFVVDVAGERIGFLVRDAAPTSVVAAIRTIEGVSDRYRRASARIEHLQQWEYQVSGLDELDTYGKDGWEAVGVWVERRCF